MRMGLFIALLLIACEEKEIIDNAFTGNEVVYPLMAGSEYPVSGTLTIKEKKEGSAFLSIILTGTSGDVQHPVHLHMGSINTADAPVAALLTPLIGRIGTSETSLNKLADESTITYAELIGLNASVKIHLAAAGPDKDVILAVTNIGTAFSNNTDMARVNIAICQ